MEKAKVVGLGKKVFYIRTGKRLEPRKEGRRAAPGAGAPPGGEGVLGALGSQREGWRRTAFLVGQPNQAVRGVSGRTAHGAAATVRAGGVSALPFRVAELGQSASILSQDAIQVTSQKLPRARKGAFLHIRFPVLFFKMPACSF